MQTITTNTPRALPTQAPEAKPRLETARLIIRALELTDAPAIQRLASDFAVADTTMNVPHPYPEGAAEQFIRGEGERFQHGEGATFAIVLKDHEEFIGVMGLNITRRFRNGEIGYWITRAHWNRGFATEAGRAVIEYGFSQLGLHKIGATYFARNPASGRVMNKLGMVQEGVLKDHVLKWNRYEDLVVYAIVNPRN